MNGKILVLGLTAGCLSVSLLGCSNPKQQLNKASANIDTVQLSNVSYQTDALSSKFALTKQPKNSTESSSDRARIGLFERSKDAVVTIKTKKATGSGFIISKDGLVITNKHVVLNEESQVADRVEIVMSDGTKINANVLGTSRHQDLALIRIPNQSRLKFLKLAKTETIKVGQNVYAIGSPSGIDNVFTSGTLNKVEKSQYLLHDARIGHGSSGGPLINDNGEFIGVNTHIAKFNEDENTVSIALNIRLVSEMLGDYQAQNSNFVTIANIDKRTQPTPLATNGQAIAGTFKSGDETDERNIYYRYYVLEGTANRQLTVEMTSNKIDPVLDLYFIDAKNKKSVKVNINSDFSPRNNNNAKISLSLPKDGIYLVVAKTFQPKETGSYQIKATLK
jgi:serine protease Do